VAVRPPLIPPVDSRRLARQIRVTGRVVLVISLFAAGWMLWTAWRPNDHPVPDEMIAANTEAERRQVGEMYGLFARDLWDTWSDLQRPYPAAAIFTASGLLIMWGLNRLARRHETES
jgi:hypothetical protein